MCTHTYMPFDVHGNVSCLLAVLFNDTLLPSLRVSVKVKTIYINAEHPSHKYPLVYLTSFPSVGFPYGWPSTSSLFANIKRTTGEHPHA